MATTFDERERAYEQRFVLEEEARFHGRNRRNRLLATWACERMALSGPAAEAYTDGCRRPPSGTAASASMPDAGTVPPA
jgi:hypothetical protein